MPKYELNKDNSRYAKVGEGNLTQNTIGNGENVERGDMIFPWLSSDEGSAMETYIQITFSTLHRLYLDIYMYVYIHIYM